LGMLAVTLLFSRLIPGNTFTRDVWTLLAGSAAGLAVYFFFLFFFFKNTFDTFWKILLSIKEVGVKLQ
jgi:hypothetical protein